MKKVLSVCVFLITAVLIFSLAFAQDINSNMVVEEQSPDGQQDGRYVLLMQKGRSMQSTRVPAMVLDTVQGIVWVARNIQDDRPAWVKTDLGQNADQNLSQRKYAGSVMQWQEGNFGTPAVVADTQKGIIWTCSDMTANPGTWVQVDFKNVTQKEVRGTELKY